MSRVRLLEQLVRDWLAYDKAVGTVGSTAKVERDLRRRSRALLGEHANTPAPKAARLVTMHLASGQREAHTVCGVNVGVVKGIAWTRGAWRRIEVGHRCKSCDRMADAAGPKR